MTENQGGDGSFEQRLRAAESRQGGKPGAKPGPGSPDGTQAASGPSALGIGMRVGVELVSALVVAVAIGWALDHWLHTLPLFLIVFVLLGGAAGILNVWRVMAPRRERVGE
jgi:ATP synthase protein I